MVRVDRGHMDCPADQAEVLALITKPIMEQGLLVRAIMAAFLKPLLMVAAAVEVEQGLLEPMELL
jgi:hypothetical protein